MTIHKIADISLPGKLTPPEIGHFFDRPELSRNLAELMTSPRKIWVSSPGGAGKTTLVRAFLDEDPRQLLWYQVDHGDHDPASFFYYMGQAVPDRMTAAQPLPQLSPEYLPNLPIFCRNFFRAFFSGFADGCVLVLDDLQEGPGETLFAPVLAAALAELPGNSSLIVLSREEPYPCFARERLNRSLAHLGWDDLRLSAAETSRFLTWAQETDSLSPEPERAYELTQGWMAGLLLLLENQADGPLPRQISLKRTDLLFDYFADEIFARLPKATRDFLLACSFLPSIEVSLVESLTGRQDTGDILRGLVRGNHFTFRISASPEIYRFHPLFRQFLLSRTGQLDALLLTETQKQAARLLVDAGQVEAAADLMITARSWRSLAELIATRAEILMRQSRIQTLLQWLEALPEELRLADPWLCYWRGCCLQAMALEAGRADLSRSFELFQKGDETAGSMLAWAMAVSSIIVGWNEFSRIDEWIGRFDHIRKEHPEFPSPQIEAQMLNAIMTALSWRQPDRPDLAEWARRLHRSVISSRDSNFRLYAGSNLAFYHISSGDLAIARSLVEFLNGDLHSTEVFPLRKLIWLAIRATLEWILFERDRCLATIEQGRALIAESGLTHFAMRLYGQGITMALTAGDLDLVRKFMDEMPEKPITAALDHSHSCLLLADFNLLQGDTAKALALAEMAVKRAEDGGSPVFLAIALSGLILALHETDQNERAGVELQKALKISRGMNFFTCYFHLLAAYFALEMLDKKNARKLLVTGFGLAARQGYLNFHPWRGKIMTRLCQEALAAGIETDYVHRLAACRNLDISPAAGPELTPREFEILTWIQGGKTSWEIGQIMGISERTVKFHVGNILAKLEASNRFQAVAIAVKMGILHQA